MTVKELIEKLQEIENKDLPVAVGVEYGHGCFAVSTDVGLSVDQTEEDEPCGVVISGEEDEDSSDW